MGRTFLQGQTVQWVPNENPGAHWQPNTADPEAVAIPSHASDDDNIRNNDTETSKMSWKKRLCCKIVCWTVLVLVIIFAGGTVWLIATKGEASPTIINFQDDNVTSSAPSPPSPSAIPTKAPSSNPTIQLIFDPPSESDCIDISRNQTIAGRENMGVAHFDMDLEVVLTNGITTMTDELMNQLLDSIQHKILPSLAGCSTILDEFIEVWRFVIFDAFVTPIIDNNQEGCTHYELVDLNCHRISIGLTLFLKAQVKPLDIISLISNEYENIANHLGLENRFGIVRLVAAQGLYPTLSPTSMPSASPSARLLYPPPSESDCNVIAKNETIAGREQMENAQFDLNFEVVLTDNSTMTDELVNQFLDSIQEIMLPSLAGCNLMPGDILEDWRFVIFDAFVTGNLVPDEACTDNIFSSQNCFRVSLQLNLFLKGSVRLLDIVGLISDKQVILSVDTLGFSAPFSALKLIRFEPKV